jgi:hypothetical protein
MAKPVVVTIEHGSSKDAVKAKLVAGLDDIRARLGPLVGSIEQQWVGGDALTFRLAALGQPVTGRIDVGDRVVRIEVLLPGLLGYLGTGSPAECNAKAWRFSTIKREPAAPSDRPRQAFAVTAQENPRFLLAG